MKLKILGLERGEMGKKKELKAKIKHLEEALAVTEFERNYKIDLITIGDVIIEKQQKQIEEQEKNLNEMARLIGQQQMEIENLKKRIPRISFGREPIR